jgi:hypothetical protein
MWVGMWFRAFSAPGRRVRPRRPGGTAQRGAQMCPLGERAPSYALWEQQGLRAAFFLFFAAARLRSVPAARPERPDPAEGAHATRARRGFPSSGRDAKAAGAASTSGTQTWRRTIFLRAGGRQLADVAPSVPSVCMGFGIRGT